MAKVATASSDTITAVGQGLSGQCLALARYADTGFLVGGSFTGTAGSPSTTLNNIAYYHYATDSLYPLRHSTGTGVNVLAGAISVRAGGSYDFAVGTRPGLGTVSSPLLVMGTMDVAAVVAYSPSSGMARLRRRQRLLLQEAEEAGEDPQRPQQQQLDQRERVLQVASGTGTRTLTRSSSATGSVSASSTGTGSTTASSTGTSTVSPSGTPSVPPSVSMSPTYTMTSTLTPPVNGTSSPTLSPGALPSLTSTPDPFPWAQLPPYDAAAAANASRLSHGLTFAIHRDARGSSALGVGGDQLGLGGITPSFALRFDTFAGNYSVSTLGFAALTKDDSQLEGYWGQYLAPYNLSWGAAYGWAVSFTYYGEAKRAVAVVGPADGSRPVIAYTFDVDLRSHLRCDADDIMAPCFANLGFTAATGSGDVYNTHRVFTFDYLNQKPTGTPTSTMSLSRSSSNSLSWSSTPSQTPSITPSGTSTPSITASGTGTASVTGSQTATQTSTPSWTATSSSTGSKTRTPSQTPSQVPTAFSDPAAALALEDAKAKGASAASSSSSAGTLSAYDWRADPNLVSLVSAPDSDYQATTTSVSVAWEPFEDVGSGIAQVAYCLGSAQFACDVVDWIPAPSVKNTVDYARFEGLTVTPGTFLYATIAAVNNVGLISMASSDGVYVDSRPPQLGQVVDTGKYFLHPEAVEGAGTVLYTSPVDINCDEEGQGVGAAWGADTVAPAGLDFFEWSVGSAPNASDILPWVNIGNVLAVYNESLTPPAGTVYYTCVRAVGLNGLTSVGCSDGVEVLNGLTSQRRMVCVQPSASDDDAHLYRYSMMTMPTDGRRR